MSASSPVPNAELERIVQKACEDVLSSTTSYVHSETEQQNSQIINFILSSLVSAASSNTENTSPHQQYKYAVNSTIIQHLVDPSPSHSTTTTSTSTNTGSEAAPEPSLATKVMNSVSNALSPEATHETSSTETSNTGSASTSSATQPSKGRRGMHSATGAYWNNETDGMWNYKYEGTATRPMDVVISVMWVAV